MWEGCEPGDNETVGNLEQNPEFLMLARQYEEAARVTPLTPYRAEIIPECRAQWHVLISQPGHERIAASHLITRGFGVYLPECENAVMRRGRVQRVRQLMFVGYVLVFVWDVGHHFRRILACVGVQDFLRHSNGSPAVLSDEIVDHIRAVENEQCPLVATLETVNLKKLKKRWRRKHKNAEEQAYRQYADNEIVATRTWSAFRDLPALDESQRNGLLRRALGLAS
jgi:transcription antitermination factor NusG